jgi:hypothetical protein
MFKTMKNLPKLVSVLAASLFMLTQSHAIAASAKHDKAIHGVVKLAPQLNGKMGPTAALYVIVRPNGVTTGAPVAAKRFTMPLNFPLHFDITTNDAMMPGTPLEGEFTLMARVSQKGSASPAAPGDLQTSKPVNGVKTDGKTVTLEIDQEKK